MSSVGALTKTTYKRDLSLFNLVMLNAMGMIGSGWLFGALYAVSYAGPMGAIFSWILGGIFVIFIAVNFMEISPMFPLAGGSTPLAEMSHGKMTAFLAGWSAWLSDIMTPTIEAIAVVTYASFYIPELINSNGTLRPYGYLVAVIVMILIFVINMQKVKIFGNITSGVMVWKWAIPILAAVTILTLTFKPTNFTAFGSFASSGPSGIFYALVLGGIIFSFEGFRAAINMAGEVKKKDYIWKSVIIAVIAVIALYVLLQTAFISGINWAAQGIPAGDWADLSAGGYIAGPFAQEAAAIGLGWLVVILLIDAIVSPAGAGISYAAYPARIFQSMAEFGYAPKVFAKLNPKSHIPLNSLILGTILGFIFLYRFPSWQLLVGILTSTLVIAYVLGPAAINVFRRTVPDKERPFRLPGSKIFAPIGFIVSFFIIYWSGFPLSLEVSVVILVGLIMYFYFHVKNGFGRRHITAGLWLVAGLIIIPIESYIGPATYGGKNFVPFPWDFIMIAITGIILYVWSQYSGWKTESLEKYLKDESSETR
ncbi:MAG: APC family permease [Candidatus Thermoplasmatota archaeon]|jgi:amino acid transporter|nr:APC family permease [Candidatus Thermoplasmatota archaeon]MCL5930699.1 APC family permease [Candidatus Thermoplasmatota archaeon]